MLSIACLGSRALDRLFFNYSQLWMEFECHGAHVRLHGAQHPTYIAFTMTALKQQM